MSETSNTSEPVEVITLDEARELLAALETLKAIADRASMAAYNVPSAISYPRSARAQDYGRLAGVANMTAGMIFNAVLTAGNYCDQAGANSAMTERSTARTAGEATS